jgi:hypothetical protein
VPAGPLHALPLCAHLPRRRRTRVGFPSISLHCEATRGAFKRSPSFSSRVPVRPPLSSLSHRRRRARAPAPFLRHSTYPAPPLAPIEAYRPLLAPTVSPPRRSSRSRGWHRTAPRSTAAGCSSALTPAANGPLVSSHTSPTSFPADPTTGAARFRRARRLHWSRDPIASPHFFPGTFL